MPLATTASVLAPVSMSTGTVNDADDDAPDATPICVIVVRANRTCAVALFVIRTSGKFVAFCASSPNAEACVSPLSCVPEIEYVLPGLSVVRTDVIVGAHDGSA